VTSDTTRPLILTLVRHGESDWNAARRTQGQDDRARLSELGRAQAAQVAVTLVPSAYDLVVTSDLARARETAAIIADLLALPVEVEPLLRERSFGILEGGPLSQVTGDLSGIVDGVVVDPDARPSEGESFRDVAARAARFLESAATRWPSGRLLVVTHGGMIRALRAHCEGLALRGLAWDPVSNCGVWTLVAPAVAS
jgi:probable phosphoglycerate mutase